MAVYLWLCLNPVNPAVCAYENRTNNKRNISLNNSTIVCVQLLIVELLTGMLLLTRTHVLGHVL